MHHCIYIAKSYNPTVFFVARKNYNMHILKFYNSNK